MLPQDIANTCNDLFGQTKTEADAMIYRQCKQRLLKKFGPKPEQDYEKAKNIVMTGLPSEAAKEIRNLMCHKKPQLKECCCSVSVGAEWKKLLPQSVKAAVAGLDIKNNFDTVIEKADEVFLATKAAAPTVAAVKSKSKNETAKKAAAVPTPGPSEDMDDSADQPAFDQWNQLTAELAAFNKNFRKQRGKGRGARGGPGKPQPKGAGSGRGAKPSSEDPPPGCCAIHQQHGRSAYYCLDPSKCPWKDYTTPRPK